MVKPAAVRNRASAGRTGPVVSKAAVSIQWLGRTERWGRHHRVKTARMPGSRPSREVSLL